MDSGLDASHRPGMTGGLPDGQINQKSVYPSHKNIPLKPSGKSKVKSAPSHPSEGRFAIVTDAEWESSGKQCRENADAHSLVVPAQAGTQYSRDVLD
jgi:hypothetical protein